MRDTIPDSMLHVPSKAFEGGDFRLQLERTDRDHFTPFVFEKLGVRVSVQAGLHAACSVRVQGGDGFVPVGEWRYPCWWPGLDMRRRIEVQLPVRCFTSFEVGVQRASEYGSFMTTDQVRVQLPTGAEHLTENEPWRFVGPRDVQHLLDTLRDREQGTSEFAPA